MPVVFDRRRPWDVDVEEPDRYLAVEEPDLLEAGRRCRVLQVVARGRISGEEGGVVGGPPSEEDGWAEMESAIDVEGTCFPSVSHS